MDKRANITLGRASRVGLLLVFLGWAPANAAKPDGPLELRLAGPQRLAVGETPSLDLIIINRTDRALAFAPPQDGSWFHWRYPRLTLRLFDAAGKEILLGRGGRCGNMNPIRRDNLLTLAPGERRRVPLTRGHPLVPFQKPGRYAVLLEYDLRAPDAAAWMIEGRASGATVDPQVAAFLERVPKIVLRTQPFRFLVEQPND